MLSDIQIVTWFVQVIYEICREYNGEEWDGFEIDDEIVMALEDLAAGVAVGGGSVKESAKKERKAQRTSFRHILVIITIHIFCLSIVDF